LQNALSVAAAQAEQVAASNTKKIKHFDFLGNLLFSEM
jgi:hypothetical protein